MTEYNNKTIDDKINNQIKLKKETELKRNRIKNNRWKETKNKRWWELNLMDEIKI